MSIFAKLKTATPKTDGLMSAKDKADYDGMVTDMTKLKTTVMGMNDDISTAKTSATDALKTANQTKEDISACNSNIESLSKVSSSLNQSITALNEFKDTTNDIITGLENASSASNTKKNEFQKTLENFSTDYNSTKQTVTNLEKSVSQIAGNTIIDGVYYSFCAPFQTVLYGLIGISLSNIIKRLCKAYRRDWCICNDWRN